MNKKQIVFLFSGHGTQYYQMGQELFKKNETFRDRIEKLDRIVMNKANYSVLRELYDEKHRRCDSFTDIRYTHLALFMVQYALAQCMMEMQIIPDYVMGSSLGEYVALTVSGAVDPEEMMEFLLIQAELLYQSNSGGGMLSVLDDLQKYRESDLLQGVEIAAVNSKKNFVVSGPLDRLKKIEEALYKKVLYSRLDIGYSFHSASMDRYSEKLGSFYASMRTGIPGIHMLSCAECSEIYEVKKDYLWGVARKPILFQETVEKYKKEDQFLYLDFSPSGTLTNYLYDILGEKDKENCFRMMSPYAGEELKQFDRTMHELKPYSERKKKMRAIVFAGQGSQKVGMGKELFELFPDLVKKADDILGYSVKKICLEDPEHVLGITQYSQPIIYVVNALSYFKLVREGEVFDYFAGHSLGEYNALMAAGFFTFEDGLRLVKQRGLLMGRSKEGGMAAFINTSEEKIGELIKRNHLNSIDFANYNSPKQIVVAGPKDDLEILIQTAKEEKIRCMELRVSAAFHSRYMSEARKDFSVFLKDFCLDFPALKVVSNYSARPYTQEEMYDFLRMQIDNPVRWTESVEYMLDQGVDEFIEAGESNILTKLIREIRENYVPRAKEEAREEKEDTKQSSGEDKREAVKYENAERKGTSIGHKGAVMDNFIHHDFLADYNVKYPYVIGGMYRGISSVSMVTRAAASGILSFFGTGGLKEEDIRLAIQAIRKQVSYGFGMNFTPSYSDENYNERMIQLFLQNDIRAVEASGFVRMVPALVEYRLKGLEQDDDGKVIIRNRIMAKLSRTEIAELFVKPAPEDIVKQLLQENRITAQEAELSKKIPMADDICLEQDSGGHTDQGSAFILFPTIRRLVEKYCIDYHYDKAIRLGIGGGIGTPEAVAVAFYMGAAFVVTGSINQGAVEAGTSGLVKQLLADMNIKDTEYAPAGDMFEIGAKVQVLKKGVFFPARANRLYEAYKFYNAIEEFDAKLLTQIEKFYFGKTISEVYNEIVDYYRKRNPEEIERAESNRKYKMALILKQYFRYATDSAIRGDESQKANFQVLCGNAMGAFNQWAKNTQFCRVEERHVDDIAFRLLEEAEVFLEKNRY